MIPRAVILGVLHIVGDWLERAIFVAAHSTEDDLLPTLRKLHADLEVAKERARSPELCRTS